MTMTPEIAEADDTVNASYRQRLEAQFNDASQELLGTLMCCVGNRDDALDAYQDTFLKCWKNREQIDQVRDLRAWVFRIAINTGRDYRKTAWNRRRRPLTDPPAGDVPMATTTDSPETQLTQQEEIQQIRNAVGRLSDEQREVFLLRQNGELTYEQIATTLSLPIGTVKTRMRMALQQLRICVGAQS